MGIVRNGILSVVLLTACGSSSPVRRPRVAGAGDADTHDVRTRGPSDHEPEPRRVPSDLPVFLAEQSATSLPMRGHFAVTSCGGQVFLRVAVPGDRLRLFRSADLLAWREDALDVVDEAQLPEQGAALGAFCVLEELFLAGAPGVILEQGQGGWVAAVREVPVPHAERVAMYEIVRSELIEGGEAVVAHGHDGRGQSLRVARFAPGEVWVRLPFETSERGVWRQLPDPCAGDAEGVELPPAQASSAVVCDDGEVRVWSAAGRHELRLPRALSDRAWSARVLSGRLFLLERTARPVAHSVVAFAVNGRWMATNIEGLRDVFVHLGRAYALGDTRIFALAPRDEAWEPPGRPGTPVQDARWSGDRSPRPPRAICDENEGDAVDCCDPSIEDCW